METAASASPLADRPAAASTELPPAAGASSPSASSPASSSANEDPPAHEKLPLPPAPAILKPSDPASDDDVGDAPSATGGGLAWGSSAFGLMKDRAATAKKTLAPQLQHMRDKTSKKCVIFVGLVHLFEKYQPTIVKAKTSASAGTERYSKAFHRIETMLLEAELTDSTALLKTKLAAAAPVAERIQTMGLNVMTDMYLGDISVDSLEQVDDPKRGCCHFLESYKTVQASADSPYRGTGLLRLSRARSTASNSSMLSADNDREASPAEQCLATSYVLGTILLFCGDLPVISHMSSVNRACRDFIVSERRLGRFCVRYGQLSPNLRFAFWEHTARVRKVRETSEFDFDTYLHMALSKGDATELIMTDVRRTYGRVAPHKRAANHKDEVSEEDLTNQLSEILHALAGRFPDVGYCQGMDYIAAHVLNKVKKRGAAQDARTEAESAFWLLVTLFERYGLHEMFAPGLHTLHVHCFQAQRLLELAQPKLAEHFAQEKVPVEMFAVGWFQTLFLYLNVLPAASLDRIWDIFLFEKNWKIMLRVAVALLQLSEEYVIAEPIDQIMQFFNTYADQADELLAEEALMERALSLKVTNNVLNKLQKQFVRHKRTSPTRS
ncbi:hypothetical protein BBJ28_00003851 [Nothophytophthora sp. Chile5]|nr:hypothetical protein BBJ28_00003851 [Nothophytophthora sp. Chile5]